jgi:hypothetical protein
VAAALGAAALARAQHDELAGAVDGYKGRIGELEARVELFGVSITALRTGAADKDAKIRLREVLLKEKHLRPLLRGLRLSLGYEAMQTWQLPPDIERLSAAVDQAVGSFCPKGWAGRVGEC